MTQNISNYKQSRSKFIITYDPLDQDNLSKTLYHFQSSMILACVGDTVGYKRAKWQFNYSGKAIQQEIKSRTDDKGILALNIIYFKPQQLNQNNIQQWIYSDDTAMHIATAVALLNTTQKDGIQQMVRKIAVQYKKCLNNFNARGAGNTTKQYLQKLKQDGSNWKSFQYNPRGAGCGGSMRSACIGLAYFKQQNLDTLIALGIQSARITHHNPIGWLGSLMAAYFTALAIQRINPKLWIYYLYNKVLLRAQQYIKKSKRNISQNLGQQWNQCRKILQKYAQSRQLPILTVKPIPSSLRKIQLKFPQNFNNVEVRQKTWLEIGFNNKWAGSLGVDSVLIALDALLYSQGNFKTFCEVAIVHGGDNDSTATIAGAFYGAYYGMRQMPTNFYREMQEFSTVNKLGRLLFEKFCLKNQNKPFVGPSQSIL